MKKPTKAPRPNLVHHDLGLGLVSSFVRGLVLLLRVVAHLNIFIATASLIFVQLVVIVVTLFLQILTLGIGLFFVLLACGFVTTGHLLVFTFTFGFTRLVGLFKFLDKGSLELGFFVTIGIAIVIQVIRLRLVGRVLGGRRLFRIPVEETLVKEPCMVRAQLHTI